MSFSTFQIYLRAFFPRVPLWHWVVMGVVALALTVVLIGRKRFSGYGAIALGVAVFMGLYLLDALALVRIGGRWVEHPDIDLGAELRRITSGNEENLMLMLFNTAVFAPFGLACNKQTYFVLFFVKMFVHFSSWVSDSLVLVYS